MEIEDSFLEQATKDLGINVIYVKGQVVQVKNCWHFSTDGNAVDVMFYDEQDFIDGMNRIYVVLKQFKIIILAFCLMDNHVHFVLYGDFDECNRFVHEYVRRTSMYLSHYHGDRHKLDDVGISHQAVTDSDYLKTVICYDHKNPYYAGLPYVPSDYPWSSGPLYFRNPKSWSVVDFNHFDVMETDLMNVRDKRLCMKTRYENLGKVRMVDNLVFPGEYVNVQLGEQIFRSHKSYFYCLSRSREDEVDSRGGVISHLTLPDADLRKYKAGIAREIFGRDSTNGLSTSDRVRLARAMKARFNCSTKQIARIVGLKFDEVRNLL